MDPRICEHCGNSFTASYNVTAEYWARRRFCSPPCSQAASRGTVRASRGRAMKTLEERFWLKVEKCGPDECWLWTGALQISGYGYLHAGPNNGGNQRWALAHRTSWELHHGPIADGLVVCHHCDNPPCCNPAHLFLGTRGDNNRDRASKGRGRESRQNGEANAFAKVTSAEVEQIKAMVAGGASQAAAGAAFGISQPQVSKIVRGMLRTKG